MVVCILLGREKARLWFFFFFQAEDGIRDLIETGVQTCALPILYSKAASPRRSSASEVSSAVLASIGAIGDRRRREKRVSPLAPSSSAARATSPRLGANIAAWRTSAGGSPAARA